MFDRVKFFSGLRDSLFPTYTQKQVDGLNNILDEWDRRQLTDLRWLAYMLATVYHETGKAMQPITEAGSQIYLTGKKYFPWIGRGLVQLTWEDNYRKFNITNPEEALEWPTALRVMFTGMINGTFTGAKLSDFFSTSANDSVNARKIINGTDKAKVISGYFDKFLAVLKSSFVDSVVSSNAPVVLQPVVPHVLVDTTDVQPVSHDNQINHPNFWDALKHAFFKR